MSGLCQHELCQRERCQHGLCQHCVCVRLLEELNFHEQEAKRLRKTLQGHAPPQVQEPICNPYYLVPSGSASKFWSRTNDVRRLEEDRERVGRTNQWLERIKRTEFNSPSCSQNWTCGAPKKILQGEWWFPNDSKFVANLSENRRPTSSTLKENTILTGRFFMKSSCCSMCFQPPRWPHVFFFQWILSVHESFVTISIFPPLLGCPVGR